MNQTSRFPAHAVSTGPLLSASEARPMLEALASAGGVIAMITGIDGAFYRPLGALMAFPTSADPVGSLSSGCIEGDLALHAQQVAETDTLRTLLYGKGSSFVDIRLPCGSGIEVTLLPIRDPAPLRATLERIDDRHETTLALPGLPDLRLRPDPRMVVFGEGPEAYGFAMLAAAAGYPVARPVRARPEEIDPRSAVVLFFHDHERELDILTAALDSDAFWIGAQGSRTAHARRCEGLQDRGVAKPAIDRVRGPIGLIPGTRDPRVLSISVLAEIIEAAR